MWLSKRGILIKCVLLALVILTILLIAFLDNIATSIKLKEITDNPNDLIPSLKFRCYDTPYELSTVIPDAPIFTDIIDLMEAGEYSKSFKSKWYYDDSSKSLGSILIIDKSYNKIKIKVFLLRYIKNLTLRKFYKYIGQYIGQQYVSERLIVYRDSTGKYLIVIAATSPQMLEELNNNFLNQKVTMPVIIDNYKYAITHITNIYAFLNSQCPMQQAPRV